MPDRMSSAHALALAIRRGAGAAAAAPTSIPGIAREGNTQSQPRNLEGAEGFASGSFISSMATK